MTTLEITLICVSVIETTISGILYTRMKRRMDAAIRELEETKLDKLGVWINAR